MNINQTSKRIALSAACTGLVAGIATKMILGETETVKFFNMDFSAPVVVAASCAAGSVVSDLTSEMIIKKIGVTNQIITGSSLAVEAGVCGAAASSVLYFGANLPARGLITSFAIGAGSKFTGDFVDEKLFSVRGIIPIF